MSIQPVRLVLSPHEMAPLFARDDAPLLMMQIIGEVSSGNFPTYMQEFWDLVRQLGVVNLWFFEKFISGYSGPYELITDHLHAEMANFYQEEVMIPGSKTAYFIGRSHSKSTVLTYGSKPWELVRDVNLSVALVRETYDYAVEFLRHVANVFTDNEFFAWLYPEYHVSNPRGQPGWNDKMLTLPNKTRDRSVPNVRPLGVGGAVAGVHVDMLDIDDPLSDTVLLGDRSSGTEMQKTTNWVFTNIKTLVKDWVASRVSVKATRYAIDDTYEPIMKDTRKQLGNWEGLGYPLNPKGTWVTFYRQSIENGEVIFPEKFTKEQFVEMEASDPWTYWTQYQNNPHKGGLSEFAGIMPESFRLDSDEHGNYFIFRPSKPGDAPGNPGLSLNNMDLVIAGDPAATDRKTSSRTSRSTMLAYARDHQNNRYILLIKAGYVSSTEWLNWAFELSELFPTRRETVLEFQGPFKALAPFFYEAERERKKYLNLRGVNAELDKDIRIRVALSPLLHQGQLYVNEIYLTEFERELIVFPGGTKKDILDAAAIGERASVQPNAPSKYEDDDFENELEDNEAPKVSSFTGY